MNWIPLSAGKSFWGYLVFIMHVPGSDTVDEFGEAGYLLE